MTRKKEMRSLFSSLTTRFDPSSSNNSTPKPSFNIDSPMTKKLEQADSIVTKWDPDRSSSSLFQESHAEAWTFINCVNDLQEVMHSLLSENTKLQMLVRAQFLMQIAMKRLQKEFYQILSMNRAFLDPELVSTSTRTSSLPSTPSSSSDFGGEDSDDDIQVADKLVVEVEDSSTNVMADLKLIAECMISSGYGKECVDIYTTIRKSIVDEGIYKLGVEKERSSKIHKMNWEDLDLKIKNWLKAVKVAVNTLFNGERILCDHVFMASDSIRESCFNEITKEGASILFGFPEIVVKHSKKSPEKIFGVLDMYTVVANHWPKIELIFSSDSTSAVIDLALNSTVKLGDWVRKALTEFEALVQKDSSKAPVHGAGIHHLTTDVMNFLSLLADYDALGNILLDSPPSTVTSLPDFNADTSDSDDYPTVPTISTRFAWLILVLLCKLDGKAKHYKDVSLSYLFLASNIQHVISKVRTSNLKYLLGDDWISQHEAKVKKFAANYELLGWSHVIEAIPVNHPTTVTSPENIRESFKRFNAMFEETQQKHSVCVIQDSKLRDEIKVSIARKVLPLYGEFYDTHANEMTKERYGGHVVKFAPEDLSNALSDLFFGSGSSSTSFTSSSHGGHRLDN